MFIFTDAACPSQSARGRAPHYPQSEMRDDGFLHAVLVIIAGGKISMERLSGN